MKTLIAAAMLLALASPAHAVTDADTAARWDCGNRTRVTEDGEFGVFVHRPLDDADYANHGVIRLDLKWDYRGGKTRVWLNGKICKQTD